MPEGGRVTAVVIAGERVTVARSLDELARALASAGGQARVLLVEGRVLATLEARAPSAGEAGAQPGPQGPASGAPQAAPPPERREASGQGLAVAAVFDQMFRGFADIVAREVPGVELHEVVGRGLERPVRVGRVYKQPARDDYDVLSLVENLASQGKLVVFFTGDKRLASQAAALGDERIIVEYMPPNEYPGKESLAKAMISAVRKAIGSTRSPAEHEGSANRSGKPPTG